MNRLKMVEEEKKKIISEAAAGNIGAMDSSSDNEKKELKKMIEDLKMEKKHSQSTMQMF